MLSNFENELLFFGVEDLNPDYVERCEKLGIKYRFVRKDQFLFPFKLYRILKSYYDLIINHSLPVVPILTNALGKRQTPFILIEHASIALKRKKDIKWTQAAVKSAAHLVYLTEANLREAAQTFELSHESSSVIKNGIDLSIFHSESKSEELHIVSHGRLTGVKKLELLLRAIQMLEHKANNIKVTIAGDGEERRKLMRQAAEYGISNIVDFPGMLKEKEISSLLSKAHIYVNCSQIESMSTSLVQAMASGVACVVSNIEGNTSLISHEENGLLFESGDSQALAAQIDRLIDDPELIRNLGSNVRLFAEKHLDAKLMQDKYFHLATQFTS